MYALKSGWGKLNDVEADEQQIPAAEIERMMKAQEVILKAAPGKLKWWEAAEITGHRTETVYKRYDIGAEAGATEAGRKLREFEARLKQFANDRPEEGSDRARENSN